MKEILVPIEFDIKKYVDWYVDQYSKSAFLIGDDDLKKCLTNMFEVCKAVSKSVETRRIEEFIFKNPGSIEENNKIQRAKQNL